MMEDNLLALVFKSASREEARMVEEMLRAYGLNARTVGHQVKREPVGLQALDAPTEHHVLVPEAEEEVAKGLLEKA